MKVPCFLYSVGVLPFDSPGADETVQEQDDPVTTLLIKLQNTRWERVNWWFWFRSADPPGPVDLDQSVLGSGFTHTMNVIEDELHDIALLVKGKQLQLKRTKTRTRMKTEDKESPERTKPHLLCKIVQLVVQIRRDAVVLGYQGNRSPLLLTGQPEAVRQSSCQSCLLVPLSHVPEGGVRHESGQRNITVLQIWIPCLTHPCPVLESHSSAVLSCPRIPVQHILVLFSI